MTVLCNVCGSTLDQPIFTTGTGRVITSVLQIIEGNLTIHACDACCHLQTQPLQNIDHYYEHHYNILTDSADEDQLVTLPGGDTVYRTDHQLDCLMRHLDIPRGARVLDMGCGKGALARALHQRRPDLDICLFDVSDVYRPFWEDFLPADRVAVRDPPDAWQGTFDLVTSFYMLEHVPEVDLAVKQQIALLRPGGQLYSVVPNVLENPGDLLVADHVNHFTRSSLLRLSNQRGVKSAGVLSNEFPNAWLLRMQRSDDDQYWTSNRPPHDPSTRPDDICNMWRTAGERLRAFEQSVRGQPAIIYGGGFYGTWIASQLAQPDAVAAVSDRNPHRHGHTIADLPIVGVDDIPPDTAAVYLGINPQHAAATLDTLRDVLPPDAAIFTLEPDAKHAAR